MSAIVGPDTGVLVAVLQAGGPLGVFLPLGVIVVAFPPPPTLTSPRAPNLHL